MADIEQIIDGVITGQRPPFELTAAVEPEEIPRILNKAAIEFYRLQAIYRGAPDGHIFKKGAHDRLPGMVKVIEALGGKVVIEDVGSPLIARGWVLTGEDQTIADDVVIAW